MTKRTDRSTVAEKNTTFRTTPRTRALLDALVEAASRDAFGTKASIGSYLAALIEREAAAKGISVPQVPSQENVATGKPSKQKRKSA